MTALIFSSFTGKKNINSYIVMMNTPIMRYTLLFVVWCLVCHTAFAQNRIRVACVGNSITEGSAIVDSLRYPARLQKLLGEGYEVRNYGIGGRTLLKHGDFPYWQEAKYQDVLAWQPDVVIIKLGTNDSKPQNWIYAEEFEKDYRTFIESFEKLPGRRKIYLCTPIPVYKDAFGITQAIVEEEIIPVIRKVGKSKGLPVIDLFAPMIGKDSLAYDGIHPDARGAAVIADVVYEAVK